ncbi:phosphonopyruvate decarboxylase, partial [Candidatus Woesearchaeota archaeon]|nr:phosphonopyruvate decarboxylase [Candidatus Woesearchaeota archaeon]
MKADAILPDEFLDLLQAEGVTFFAGVPDSLLKHFCSCVSERMPQSQHVITANEGSAVALAMGQQIGSGELPLVYMQNSGLGNAINPLLSLADELVYGIPMVLVIGWRGEISADGTQLADEPQHVKQGRVTLPLLDAMGIPYAIISRDTGAAMQEASAIIDRARNESRPVALVVRKDSFAPYMSTSSTEAAGNGLLREAAIGSVIKCLPANAVVVATTGMASRELYELREARHEGHFRDFLTVGGMGHASQIALGIARARPETPVVCLDGDGAFLMHMGGIPYTARQPNLIHVVLNNGCHDSVGGQRTLAATLDLARIATSCGFEHVDR